MKLAIMQPYLFPYIGYFQLINAVDRFVVLDDVNHIKRGWVNRNRLLVNGEPHMFTMPLKDASQNRLICEIELSPEAVAWRNSFLRTLEFNYRKASEFATVYPLLREIVMYDTASMVDYICNSLKRICEWLAFDTAMVWSSRCYGAKTSAGQERILDICRREGTDNYINPIGGTEIYEKETFSRHGICLNFLQSGDIRYRQFDDEFVPWLSIIDVMMFNPVPKIEELLKQYKLV